jgi:hypothetical protein
MDYELWIMDYELAGAGVRLPPFTIIPVSVKICPIRPIRVLWNADDTDGADAHGF